MGDAHTYEEVFQFLLQGALVRIQEFIDGNRAFKVMGLFLLGFYIIGQSVWGILIFYGIGFGLGSDTGLVYVLLIATGAYVIEIIFSLLWLRYCQFGPLEWIWRMLTYGKWLKLLK